MITVGLTGGMGCGKTTAAGFFVEQGFRSLDTDAIVHGLLADNVAVREAVSRRFGPDVLNSDGGIERRKLGAVVFADSEALVWLEGLIHPLVREIWRGEVSARPEEPWVIQIPLLFEKKLEQCFDFTVCVGTSDDIQRRRLLRRGLSAQEVDRRISRQLPVTTKAARADFFLLNDGSPDFLREQVQRLCLQLPMTHGSN